MNTREFMYVRSTVDTVAICFLEREGICVTIFGISNTVLSLAKSFVLRDTLLDRVCRPSIQVVDRYNCSRGPVFQEGESNGPYNLFIFLHVVFI